MLVWSGDKSYVKLVTKLSMILANKVTIHNDFNNQPMSLTINRHCFTVNNHTVYKL